MDDREYLDKLGEIGGFAFPSQSKLPSGGDLNSHGMSLRDWFAGQALLGLLADGENMRAHQRAGHDLGEWVASSAYHTADAMLKARSDG